MDMRALGGVEGDFFTGLFVIELDCAPMALFS
jgi:hypothetical protein